MSLGRSVPWSCWEEWQQVGEWLQSNDASTVKKGLDRVATWRSRGRVPLGVDSTASFVETRQSDKSGTLSQLPLRMQYSLAVVRMVNGIADSSQKGRMAASVASLTAAAGLPRLLVDLRHEATHNELPSLAALQLAAHHALTWLRTNYWQKQKDHVELNKARISGIIGDYVGLHMAAAIKAAAATQKQDCDTDEDEEEEEKDKGGGGGGGNTTRSSTIPGDYNVAQARKQRQTLLTELRVAVPAPATHLLIDGLLQAQITASNESPSQVVARALTHSMKHLLQEGWSQLPTVLLDTVAIALGNIETFTITAKSTSSCLGPVPASIASLADWNIWLEVLAPEGKVDVSETAARSIIATSLLSLSDIEQAPLNRWLQNSLPAVAPAPTAEDDDDKDNTAKELDTQRVSTLKRLLEVTLPCLEDKDLKQRCLAVAGRVYLSASTDDAAIKGQPNVQVVAELQRLSYEVLDFAAKGTQGNCTSLSKRPHSLENTSQDKDEKVNKKSPQQRWSTSQNWLPCAIGMLPSAVDSNGKIPRLELKDSLQLRELPKEGALAALGIETTTGGGFGGDGGAAAMTLEEEEDDEEQLNGNTGHNTAEEDDMLEEEEEGPPPSPSAAAARGRCPPPSAVRPQI